ncbi:efflux RND transporter periplasmic adaptor subunit [Rhizobium sp. XQZ8]|uniref:efflux RND transporter periplasmic adaptor subunit n=1 Tax=Rhizobium populisoli TaxID=2859785 RepID=UPI001CA4AD62|nr:efflux RND transporter periplasmic adaptor subunit [Rhizobium populisoli]MBW6424204.1 efflux RND transporter periplasmic adaptor subunit [Rhizobium populisoli]
MPVTAMVARENAIIDRIEVVGTLAAREEIQVHPMVLGKEIRQILVEAGDHVAAGQALALLDTTEAQMMLGKNAVALVRAKAGVAVESSRLDMALIGEEEARRKLERSRMLQPKGAIADNILEEHQNAYARAGAELRLARQSLELAEAEEQLISRERQEIQLTVERSTIRAPGGGRILSRNARVGAMTSGSGEPLFLIAGDDDIEFTAQVTETSFVRLQPGMRAAIALPGRSLSIPGTIRLNAARLDPKTRSGTVHIELPGNEGLVPGIFARGTIELAERRNILVPGSAIRSAGGTSNVYVVSGGVVDVRPVRVGASQEGLVEILDGIGDGETIALKAGAFLKAEERVSPILVIPAELQASRPATPKVAGNLVGALVQ